MATEAGDLSRGHERLEGRPSAGQGSIRALRELVPGSLGREADAGNEWSLLGRSHRPAGIGMSTEQGRRRQERGGSPEAEWQRAFKRSRESRESSHWKWRRPRSRQSHALHGHRSSCDATDLSTESPCPRRNSPCIYHPGAHVHTGCIYCFSQILPNFDSCFTSRVMYRAVRATSTLHARPVAKEG